MNAGLLEDVRLAAGHDLPVAFYGRMGGMVPTTEDVLSALKSAYCEFVAESAPVVGKVKG